MLFADASNASFQWHVGETFPYKLISKIRSFTADGHELEIFKSSYPTFLGDAQVQTFFGDIAKMMITNTKSVKKY